LFFSFILETNESDDKEIHFRRIEVKESAEQFGFVQIDLLQKINKEAKIALKGDCFIQSHLTKNQGGGGHAH
jgi:cobalt-zinc-cadmium efflux system membrane fusion protein